MGIKKMISSLVSDSEYYRYVSHPAETLNILQEQISETIAVKSSFYGTIDKFDHYMEARVSPDIQSGDTLLMFISSSDPGTKSPWRFKDILHAADNKHQINFKCSYKVWQQGDPMAYKVFTEEMGDLFVALITLSGTCVIDDARSRADNSTVLNGQMVAPRVRLKEDGIHLTAFAYDDPGEIVIDGQMTIASIETNNRGLAIGVCPTEGGDGSSRRVRAHCCSGEACSSADDVVFSLGISRVAGL